MPPPPTKRIKRPPKVLDEDAYTDALSKIIARDFFPGLVETQTQQEYLDALESQNSEWIAHAGRKLTEVMTPGPTNRRTRRGTSLATPKFQDHTPRGGYRGDTPMSVVSSMTTTTTTESVATQTPDVDLEMSLDRFQATYTSEDNESFNKVLDKQNRKRAERYRWLWAGNKIPAVRQIKYREREEKKLLQEKANDGVRLITGPDERKAIPDTWIARPDNQVFFAPDSVEDEYETVQQSAEARSRAPPKAVTYDNTRFPPPPPEADPTIPPSPSISAIRDAIAGRPRASTTSEASFSGGQTPRVNGYAFVDDEEPSATDINSATMLLGTGDATPNPFKIREQSKRESLHHRMVDRVAKNNRPATGRRSVLGGGTPVTPGSPMMKSRGELTPAGQRLWSRVASPAVLAGGTKAGESKGVRISWTPTPRGGRGDVKE